MIALSCAEERPEPHRVPGKRIRAAFLAVDNTDRAPYRETTGAQRFDRVEQRTAGGDDVLDETHRLTVRVEAFDPIRRAVVLRRLAHD